MSQITTTFYVQLEPEFYTDGKVWRLNAVRMTRRRPRVQMAGTALVKLRLELDDRAFAELEAVVTVPPPHLSLVQARSLELVELTGQEGSGDDGS